jgi:3-phenylpropionate/trans-cinnamate dioxygenase ferredoxin component
MEYLKISELNGCMEGVLRRIEVEGRAVLLVKAEGELFAVDDTCTHEDASLAGGFIEETTIECPRHGAIFDLQSGKALTLPATRDLGCYPVRLEGEDVLIGIEK